jgi:hypothetical protein
VDGVSAVGTRIGVSMPKPSPIGGLLRTGV